MRDQEYTITEVQSRDDWTGAYGPMKAYALHLEDVEGWVSLNQKPETAAPAVGGKLFGHMDTKTSKDGSKTWLQFKKEARPDQQGGGYSGGASGKDMSYIIQMLEELTGRRAKPDQLPDDEDVDDKPIDLAEIPF